MSRRKAAACLALAALIVAAPARAASGTPSVAPTPIADADLQPSTIVDGGADVLPTDRTVPHSWTAAFDPLDGRTYGYNIVGANPATCRGAACDVTVQVDVTPIDIVVDGMTFRGSDVVGAALASPMFATNDFGTTRFATGSSSTAPRAAGGVLSQEDAGLPLQLQDAVMRAQAGRTGQSSYHLRLQPNVQPMVTLDVPANQGVLRVSGRGVVFAAVDLQWWLPHLHNLETKADPTHLALYLSDDTMIYVGGPKAMGCCAVGIHGANASSPSLVGSGNSNGNAKVHTYAWATWLSPGLFARPNGRLFWYFQDVTVLSHELGEWANDPFASNAVQPTPFDPSDVAGGCDPLLETADPVENAAFTVPGNAFRQGPNPNGSQSADGFYHPQDEAFIPWFLRTAPNLASEPTQSASANVGRYTFMGDLNRFPGFDRPAPACP